MIKFPFIKTNRLGIFDILGNIDWDAIKKFLDGWKDGTKGYITVHKVGKPKSPEQLGYYYAVILPTAFEAFKESESNLVLHINNKDVELPLTKDNVDMALKLRYAERTGEYKDKSDMTMAECAAFEDWAIMWCAKWLGCQIPPSDPNWRDRPHYQEI